CAHSVCLTYLSLHFPALRTCSSHFHAVATISSSDRLAFHFSSFSARVGSATSSGGSPGRGGAVRLGTSRPVTRLMVERISRTECPWPVPRLTACEDPAGRYSRARTWASARSLTWM